MRYSLPGEHRIGNRLSITRADFVVELNNLPYLQIISGYTAAYEGQYLYENTSGAVVYKKCDASDAKSHWKFTPSDKEGIYYMQNRDTGNYITNKGNGTLRCLSKDQAIIEGSLWGSLQETQRIS